MNIKSKQINNNYLIISFLIGVIIFILIYGIKPLDVTYDAWIFNGYIETDIIQRYGGWIAYRSQDSFFPLTYSSMINYPFGDYTSLADSIPLAMIFFKIFEPLLPDVFQFCGLLACLNMALQSYFGAKVISLFTDNKFVILISSAITCFSPILLERIFRHTSLSFHWLLLYAIYLYIKGVINSDNKVVYPFFIITVLSVFIHLYFTPMIVGLFLAYVLDSSVNLKSMSLKNISVFILSLVSAFISAYSLGLLNIGTGNTSGYGTMGMNLNALFNPVSLGEAWWVPGGGKIDWSLILPIRALAENNIESFNYLGLGILITLALFAIYFLIHLFKLKKESIKYLKDTFFKTPFLYLFIIFSFFFAISNNVYAFSYKIISYNLPAFLLNIFSAFRASGRLFWSVNYLLVILAICFIILIFKDRKKLQISLLLLILIVQVVDMSPALIEKHNSFSENYIYTKSISVEYMQDNDTLFFLEIIEDRATTASLLKEGISNNLLLISRDGYGIEEMQTEIESVRKNLLDGINPYENCVYTTTDESFALDLIKTSNFSVEQFENRYYIYKN